MKLINIITTEIKPYNLIATEGNNGTIVVEGGIDVLISDGSFAETIQVKIVVEEDFPKSIPKVYDKANRFPKVKGVNFHFNPPDNNCCLFLIDERWKYFPKNSSFNYFLKGPVNNFFLNHLYFEKNGVWAKGQRRHGIDGIYEYYQEVLWFLKDKDSVKSALLIMNSDVFKSHLLCPCGAKNYKGIRKISQCHAHRYVLFVLGRKIGKEQIQKTLNMLFTGH